MADTVKDDLKKGLKHPRVRPFLVAAAELPATVATHAAWGHSPLAAAGLTLGAVTFTGAAWWAGRNTSRPRRLHATVTTAAASSYLVAGTIADPLSPGMLSTLAIGGMVGAGSWTLRQVLRVNPDPKQDAPAPAAAGPSGTGILEKSLGKAKVMLRGEVKVEPNKVTVPYKLAPGEMSADELGRRLTQIASELGVSPNAIRNIMSPDNAAEGELVVVPKDMLTEPQPWPGPSAVGGSITEPVVIGCYEDGAPEQLWFPHDPVTKRNATHFGVFGMNGSAKSSGVTIAMVDVLTRRDVIVWACDPSKGMQTLGPLLPYLDWAEMTTAGAHSMIDALQQVITARADALGRAGYKNWCPEAHQKLGMPYLIAWIEEAATIFRDGGELEGLVEALRSAGGSAIISLQRPSATTMPTDVREQLGAVLCFGVKGSTTADMALPDDVRDAGARPEAWENRRPGYNYLVAPGVDEDRYAMKARTFLPPSDDEIDATLSAVPRVHADAVTTVAAGEAYARRTIHAAGGDPAAADTWETAMSKEQQDAAEVELIDRQMSRALDAMGDDDTDPGDYPDTDPDQEIPAAGRVWQFAAAEPQEQEKSTEAAMAAVLEMLAEFRAQGRETVGPRDFQPHGRTGRIGRSRGWLSAVLTDLADEGLHIEDTDKIGVYKLLDPTLTPA